MSGSSANSPAAGGPGGRAELTGSLEDYLETIYLLIRERSFARVRDIARARDVKAGSVSPALRRLADMGLVDYEQREYIGLTSAGERAARRVYARHQLLRRFFAEVLQMPLAAAEAEACNMEHSLSDEAMDRLARLFEFLQVCPSGWPRFLEAYQRCPLVGLEPAGQTCPAAPRPHYDESGQPAGQCIALPAGVEPCAVLPTTEAEPLGRRISDLEPGECGRIMRLDAPSVVRQRLLDMGMLPDAVIEVQRVASEGGRVWIKLQSSRLVLERPEAEAVLVGAP